MKKLFSNLFSRIAKFGRTTRTAVEVFDTKDKGPKRKKLYFGFIESVDFNKRVVTVYEDLGGVHKIGFDEIVTLGRMEDGRLRMWIKVED